MIILVWVKLAAGCSVRFGGEPSQERCHRAVQINYLHHLEQRFERKYYENGRVYLFLMDVVKGGVQLNAVALEGKSMVILLRMTNQSLIHHIANTKNGQGHFQFSSSFQNTV